MCLKTTRQYILYTKGFDLILLHSAAAVILLYLGPEQTFTTSLVKGFTTSLVKGFTSEVQLTQERNLYQKATVKQFTCTSEVNRPSLPSLFHHGVHFLASLLL